MIGKPTSPALSGMALLCTLLLVACSNGPSLHFVAVTPVSGTVYFSSGPAGGVKGARAGAASTRKRPAVVSPQDITNASCGSLQFAATAYFSDGSSKDETNAVTWSSSNTSVASVSATGNASGIGLGTSNIGAVFNGVTAAPGSLEVDELNSITMMPPTRNIASGGSQQFVANGNFTLANGSQVQQPIVGTQLTWMSSDPNLVTVDQNGNATSTGNGGGQVMITATSCDGLTVGKAILNVGAPPVTLVITPSMPTIAAGTTLQFTAAHSDGSPVANAITWQAMQAGNTTVATVDPNLGIALGVSSGTSTITATEAVTGFTGNTSLMVQSAAARYAYATNLGGSPPGNQVISNYVVSVPTGTFTPNPMQNGFSPGTENARQVLIHPSGDFLYYIATDCSLISAFIDSTTGVLTLTPQPAQPTISGLATCVGAIDPVGRFIYVLNAEKSAIYGFSITQPTAQSGKMGSTVAALTPISGFGPPNGHTDPTLNFPDWILIDRTGSFLYVINNTNNTAAGTISQYSIGADGSLSPLNPATVPAGNGTTNAPFYGTIDVNGNLFVANLGNALGDPETVSGYKITATGQLSSLGPDVMTGATTAINVLTSPVANYLYVLDQDSAGNGQVFAYSYTIGASSFTLTPIGSPIATGNTPDGMAIDPTGSLLAIDNFGLNPGPPTGSISLYTVTPSGASAGGLTAANPASVPAGTSTQFVSYYNALSGQ